MRTRSAFMLINIKIKFDKDYHDMWYVLNKGTNITNKNTYNNLKIFHNKKVRFILKYLV